MGLCRKTIWLLAVLALLSVSFAQNGSSHAAPALQSTINSRSLTSPMSQSQINTRRGTQPVSSYQSGLVRSPNPINDYGNRIVTGNVGGGKHFRGAVPYNAVSDFGGRLGSGTLDNFLRRSTVSSDYYSGGLTPYYSYTGTVTRVQPGTNMIVTAPSSRIRTDTSLGGDSFITTPRIARQQSPASRLSPTGRIIFAPIGEEEETSDYDYTGLQQRLPLQQEVSQSQNYKVELKDFNKRLEELRKETEELQKQLLDEGSARLSSPKSEDKEKEPDQTEEKPGLYDEMVKEYQEQKEIYDQLYPDEAEKDEQQDSSMLKVKLGERKLKYKQAPPQSAPETPKDEKPAAEREQTESAIKARARVAEEDFDSFTVETNTKFDKYMASAQENMKNGKFYLAANDYSYATLYKLNDPLAYAGKSRALFAAGEYVSSAININRAIELSGDYADVKVDIVSLVGDRDTVEKRLVDIDNWYGVTSSAELKFLQAYIYMQMDRLDKASEAIEIAKEKMSDMPAVNTLAEAIKNRAK